MRNACSIWALRDDRAAATGQEADENPQCPDVPHPSCFRFSPTVSGDAKWHQSTLWAAMKALVPVGAVRGRC